MQLLQPMQRSASKSTMPSSRRKRALVGQMVMQGASSQWLHRSTRKCRRLSGKVPLSTYLTQVRNSPSGTPFSALHATVQAWQPIHVRWSMTKPRRVISHSFPPGRTGPMPNGGWKRPCKRMIAPWTCPCQGSVFARLSNHGRAHLSILDHLVADVGASRRAEQQSVAAAPTPKRRKVWWSRRP